MSTSTTQTETLGDNAQLIALINPIFVTRPYVSYLKKMENGTGYFMIKSFIFKNRRGDAADATRG
jgi:hypothetical protein